MKANQVNLTNRSLEEVERLYRAGYIGEADTDEYIRKWNSGPHFMQAVLADGAIRLFDPEKSWGVYQHLAERFGIRR